MSTKLFWIGLGLIVTLTAGGTLLHGRFSNRWGSPQSLIDAGARLEHIPESVEMWEFQSAAPLQESAKGMLECAGDISRSYVSPSSKAAVQLSLILGPVGTIAVHTPEICFSTKNFRLLGERNRVRIVDASGTEHQFWRVEFRTQDVEAPLMHVYYAWSVGGAWTAPDDPRFEYAGNPYLYKVQLTGFSSPSALDESNDPVPSFLSTFLPLAATEIESVGANR